MSVIFKKAGMSIGSNYVKKVPGIQGKNPIWEEIPEIPSADQHQQQQESNPASSTSAKPKPPRVKKQKRPIPPGISKSDAKILKKVRRKAHRLEWCFSMCGLACGWSIVIGLVPGIGDFFNLWLSLRLLTLCESIEGGLPPTLRAKMMSHIMVDFLISITPILGDIAGAIYKSNSKNSILLEGLLAQRGAANLNNNGHAGAGESYTDDDFQTV